MLRIAVCIALLALILPVAAAPPEPVSLDGLESIAAWQPRPDGGQPPRFSLERTRVHGGKGAMRVVYRNGNSGWGNLQRPITLPAGDGSLAFWLYKERAEPEAAMHLWLEEPDGDLWVAPVTEGGDNLGRWASGWHRVMVPLRAFRFDPRGNKRPERGKAVRMLLGCNYGDFEVVVDDLQFVPSGGSGKKEPPLVQRQSISLGDTSPEVEKMLGGGWHPGEGADLGRWTGRDGKAAELRLHLDAGRDTLLVFRGIVPAEKWKGRRDVAVTVEGQPVPAEVDAANGILRVHLAPAPNSRDVLLTLTTGTFVPAERGEGNDTRSLGMKVTTLEIAGFAQSGPQPVPVRTAKGSVAILRDELPRSGAPSDPNTLADLLRAGGYGVTFVSAADLVNPLVLNRRNFDLLVLPYGADYPADGAETLVAYLRSGGAFLSTGGYAFNNLLAHSGGKWVDRATEPGAFSPEQDEVQINTARGQQQDSMILKPEQIGAFDPSYPLTGAVRALAAPRQFVAPRDLRLEGPFEGFAAVGMFGSNSPVFPKGHARWIPLLNAQDADGRQRGALGALALHYDGPYAGSAWAFFGVTNRDLFAKDNPAMGRLFVSTVDALLQRVFLHDARPEWFSYRAGETVRLSASVRNDGARAVKASVRFVVEGGPAAKEVDAGEIAPGKSARLEAQWPAIPFARDLYRVTATLLLDGKPVDEMESGFAVWDPKLVAAGPRLDLRSNYFRIDGRPAFLCGTNETGMIFASAWDDPLVWDRDLAQMNDNGVNLIRVLHFSPFAGGPGKPNMRDPLGLRERSELLVRQTDALVQLCQKHHVALFLSLHDWMGLGLSDAELAAQRDWAHFWAERYKDAPGLFYDVQNEPSVDMPDNPDMRRDWNAFLRRRHGNDEALRAAWGATPPEKPLGEIPLAEPKAEWSSVRARDYQLFRVEVLNRWVRATVEGVHAANPRALCAVGYLQTLNSAEKLLGTHEADFSNMHSYLHPNDLPKNLKFIDRRFEGKTFSLGEFGAKCHPAWSPSAFVGVSEAKGADYFLRVGHYALGLGASFIANWSWKDMIDCVFPWGIVHPGDGVPKDVLPAYRNMSLFFRLFRPRYSDPGLYVLAPDSHRFGGANDVVNKATLNAIQWLIEARVPFNVINEFDLAKLPATARTMIWPVPYCPDDEAYAQVKRFVERGGCLLVTGDVSYDADRRLTRAARLRELCGMVATTGAATAPDLRAPVAATPAGAKRADAAEPALFTTALGTGRVFYCPSPVEMGGGEGRALYARFLATAGVKPEPIDAPAVVNAFRVETEEPGSVWSFFHTAERGESASISVAGVRLALAPGKSGLLRLDAQGRVVAAEADGPVAVGGTPVVEITGHAMVASLDGQPLEASRALLVLPVGAGEVRLPGSTGWAGAVAQAGEFRRGKWSALATEPIAGQGITVRVPAERRNDLFLVCERSEAARWAGVLEQLLAFK